MAGLKHVLNPETGMYELQPESFVNPSVPGANTGVDPAALQEPIAQYNDTNAEAAAGAVDAQTTQLGQATAELTEEQKAAEEQRKANVNAQKAQLATQKAQLDQADAEAGAGIRPEPEGPIVPEEEMVFSEEEGTVIDAPQPQGEALISRGFEGQRTAVSEQAGLQAKRATEEAELGEVLGEQALEDVKDLAAIGEKRTEIRNSLEGINNQIQQEIDTDIKKPSASIGGIIGAFLGGLIAPMQGGRNVALETVQKQLQREVEVEVENKRKRMQGLQAKKGIVGDQSDEITREAVATDMLMSKKLKALGLTLKSQIDQGLAHPESMANMNALHAEIDKLQGSHQTKAAQAVMEMQLKRDQAESRRIAALAKGKKGRGGGGKQKTTILDAAKELGVAKEDIPRLISITTTGQDGKKSKGFLTSDPVAARKFNESAPIRERAMEEMGEIARMMHGDEFLLNTPIGGTDAGARLGTRYNMLLLQMKEVTNLGVLNGKDLDILKDITGLDPTDIKNLTPERIRENLKQLYQITGRDLATKVDRLSFGTAKYEYSGFDSISRDPGEARGRTNKELNLQLDTVVSDAKKAKTPEERAAVAGELVQTADELLGQGISTANIKEAETMLKKLDRVPKEMRRTFGEESGSDRHLQLSTAIQNWKGKGATDTQKTVQSRTRKTLEKAEKIRKLKKAANKVKPILDRPGGA